MPVRLADVTADLRDQHAVLDYVRLLSCYQVQDSPEAALARFREKWPRALHVDLVKALELHTKAAVGAGTTTDATWAGPLAPSALVAGFLALLRSASLLGRIPGLRLVPFNVKVPTQTNAGSYAWVAQAASKPVTKLAFDPGILLAITKAAGIIAVTEELARIVVPGTETALRDALVSGVTAFVDRQMLDPAVAATAANPASLTNGVTPTAAGAALVDTVSAVVGALLAARPGARDAVVVMSAASASALAGSGKSLTAAVTGGSVAGVPLVTTEAAVGLVVAIDPAGVCVADGGVTVDVSREAAIEMDSAPAGGAAAVVTSLWELNMAGFRVERTINYKAVSGAVQYAVVTT